MKRYEDEVIIVIFYHTSNENAVFYNLFVIKHVKFTILNLSRK
jgi:hypothetical protein